MKLNVRKSIFCTNEILSNLQEFSIKKSVVSARLEDSEEEENDYKHQSDQKRNISLPLLPLIKLEYKSNSDVKKLSILKGKMDKILAFVDHLNYRLMIINDNLETIKKHRFNPRLVQSDDEGDYLDEPVINRKVFSSKKDQRSQFKPYDVDLEEDQKEEFLDRDSLQKKIFFLESEKKLLKEHL